MFPRHIRIILLFIVLSILSCKETVEIKYENGQIKERYNIKRDDNKNEVKDGDYISFYKNGQKSFECKYKDNFITGKAFSWYDNGQKKIECIYSQGTLSGKYLTWHPNGNKKEECNYKNGLLEGFYLSWYSNGNKEIECTYIDSLLDGEYSSWYENGKKRIKCTYKKGILNGDYSSWYENGNKKLECTYVDSILHGRYKSWHEKGNKNIECDYKKGQIDGKHIYNSAIKKLRVYINSVNSDFEAVGGTAYISDLLNSGIKNAQAYVDKKTGQLIVKFDYPSQAWPFSIGYYNKVMQYMRCQPIMIRIFDRNDKYLYHFSTWERWLPSAVIQKLKKINVPLDPENPINKLRYLKKQGNVFKHKLNAQVVDYSKTIEVGFSAYNKVIHSDALRVPPYWSKSEETDFIANWDRGMLR